MKNKQTKIILIIIVLLVVVGLIVFGFLKGKKDKQNKPENDNNIIAEGLELKSGEIKNLEKVDLSKLPSFILRIGGSYEGEINNDFLKYYEVEVFEFDFGEDYYEGEAIFTNHFIGFKLTDALNSLEIENYEKIEVLSDTKNLTIENSEVTDDIYITVYTKGEAHNIDLLDTKEQKNSTKNVTELSIYHKVEESNPPTDENAE